MQKHHFYFVRGYEEVPWDNFLPSKLWPPVSTMESKPDNVSQRWHNKRYDQAAQEWQVKVLSP